MSARKAQGALSRQREPPQGADNAEGNKSALVNMLKIHYQTAVHPRR
jgi:hypothetical protein